MYIISLQSGLRVLAHASFELDGWPAEVDKMAPKRQSSLKATDTLTSKRRQQLTKPQKATPSVKKDTPNSPKIKSPTNRIISDLEKESTLKGLKAFDLVSKYGPCVGISRLDRWKRADQYGKQPPAWIEELLTDAALIEAMGTDLTENLWHGQV